MNIDIYHRTLWMQGCNFAMIIIMITGGHYDYHHSGNMVMYFYNSTLVKLYYIQLFNYIYQTNHMLT